MSPSTSSQRPTRTIVLLGGALLLAFGRGCSGKSNLGSNAVAGGSAGAGAIGGTAGLAAGTGTTGGIGFAAVSGGSGAGGFGGGGAGTADGGAGGNGAGTADGGAAGSETDCTDSDGIICDPNGFPFAVRVVRSCGAADGSIADCPNPATTATLSQPDAGELCMSGTTTTWAVMDLIFTRFSPDRTEVLETFEPDELGITQLAFTLDSPTGTGVGVSAGILTSFGCPDGLPRCGTGPAFNFLTEGVRTSFPPGQHALPFAGFEDSEGLTFGSISLHDIGFFAGGPGAYEICIRDFRFLDADGNEVRAPE